jgi:hypothetical protein
MFVILGIATVLLVWLQAYRNARAQKQLVAQISNIEQNTAKPPNRAHLNITQVKPLPLVKGQPISANVYFKNDGTDSAEWAEVGGVGFYPFSEDPVMQKKNEDEFFSPVPRLQFKSVPHTLRPDLPSFLTKQGTVWSISEIKKFKIGPHVYFAAGEFRYKDKLQTYIADYCFYWFQPDSAVVQCHEHND